MEREELAETIIASYFDPGVRKREMLVTVPPGTGYRYLMARNAADEGFFLVGVHGVSS